MPPHPLVAGNWKMNGLRDSLDELKAIRDGAAGGKASLLICPPFTLIALAAEAVSGAIAIGGQDCHPAASGAHTGDVSAEMLADCGASHVILGHSERRADHGETSAVVKAKAEAALRAGLVAIICVGETRQERDVGRTLDVVGTQLRESLPAEGGDSNTVVIAYEPVWAIGTGLTPTLDDVSRVHAFIRDELIKRFGEEGASFRILYGGSVKPSNAAELMAVSNVNGALVGGASLNAEDFLAIAGAYA